MKDRLKLVRENLRYSQKEFAEKIGMTQATYSNYELGTRELKANMMKSLQDIYKVNLNWLINSKGEMFMSENESSQHINGNKSIGINNSTISITRSNDKEMQEILQDLYSLPDNKRKKIYHLIKAELTEL